MKKKNPGYSVKDFTVGILHCEIENAVVGTGFVVSPDGKIVTCSHVLRDAGVMLDGNSTPELNVIFPQREKRISKIMRAKVVAYLDADHDDVALLQLTNGPSPVGPEKVPRLEKAEDSLHYNFQSFGYRKLGEYVELPAFGCIVDIAISEVNLICNRVMLMSQHIDSGMSGAPVAVEDEDGKAYRVVGIIVQANDSAKSQKDKDTSFAVDALIFARYQPFREYIDDLQNIPPIFENLIPKTDLSLASRAISPNPDIVWNSAPPVPDHWVSRDKLMDALSNHWKDGSTRLISLIGEGGYGKTTFARKFAEDLLLNRWIELPKVNRIFWWCFEDMPHVEDFFGSALSYLGGENFDPNEFKSINARMHFLSGMIAGVEKQGCCLFILDGLNNEQHLNKDLYGSIRNEELRQFISYLALHGHCLAISNMPLLDYTDISSHAQFNIARLSNLEARELLRKRGAKGPDDELDKVVTASNCNGQPFMLNHLANICVRFFDGDVRKLLGSGLLL
jgi:hypothetical protein